MKYLITIVCLLSSVFLSASDNYPTNNSIDVISYVFSIHLSDSYDKINGEADIKINYTGRTGEVFFDLIQAGDDGRGMIVEEVVVDGSEALFTQSENRLVIELEKEKSEGETSNIIIKYFGTPRDGLIISENKHGGRTFFADNWPDRARNWIPCIDHPSDKAKVDFKVYAPEYYKVVSNGLLIEETSFSEGVKLTHWKEEISIPTKVMVIGVARFASHLVASVDGIDIWTYVFPEDREAGFQDYEIAVKPFKFYSNTLGTYPYEKLANVQSKTIFGGMENAGCIFYSERSVSGKNNMESLMAHEIAHQWFGNSISELDWHHVWLSEGFATYFTSYYLEKQYGENNMKGSMQQSRNRVIRAYERRPSPVIDTTITNFMRLLNTNSYQKGAWVLHMLRNELGEKKFISGIRSYYNLFNNRNALTSDFRKVMEDISGIDLEEFFYQWLYRPELPVLKLDWSYNDRDHKTTIIVSQQQQDYLFDLPVEIEIVGDVSSSIEKVRLNKAETTIVLETDSAPRDILLDPNVKLLYIDWKTATN